MRRASRLLRYVPQSVIAAALVAAALYFQPWVLVDPIDRFTHLNGASRSMIPQVFVEGESMSAVTDRLARSGYVHFAVNEAEGFTDLFRKSGVAFTIACSLDYVVRIKRDADLVVAAQSDILHLCL
jgi:hypothetical protein